MRQLDLRGVVQGKTPRTTITDEHAMRLPADLMQHRSPPIGRTGCGSPTSSACPPGRDGQNRFIIDAYSRRIPGWRAATSMRTASCWTP